MPHFEVSKNVLEGASLTSCRNIAEDDRVKKHRSYIGW